jgi:hypothetical protein
VTKNKAKRQAKFKQNSVLASKTASKAQANRKQKTNFASDHVYFGLPIVNNRGSTATSLRRIPHTGDNENGDEDDSVYWWSFGAYGNEGPVRSGKGGKLGPGRLPRGGRMAGDAISMRGCSASRRGFG